MNPSSAGWLDSQAQSGLPLDGGIMRCGRWGVKWRVGAHHRSGVRLVLIWNGIFAPPGRFPEPAHTGV